MGTQGVRDSHVAMPEVEMRMGQIGSGASSSVSVGPLQAKSRVWTLIPKAPSLQITRPFQCVGALLTPNQPFGPHKAFTTKGSAHGLGLY